MRRRRARDGPGGLGDDDSGEAAGAGTECFDDPVVAQAGEGGGEQREGDDGKRDGETDDGHDSHDVRAHVGDDVGFLPGELVAGLHGRVG